MSEESAVDAWPSAGAKALATLRLAYNELQYWVVGLTPETYYWKKGRAWEDLGNYRRAAKNFSAYLDNSDDPQVRVMLGYCHANLGDWRRAADEYKRALQKSRDPAIVLSLAEAHCALGEGDAARALIALAEHGDAPLPARLSPFVAAMKGKLGVPSC